MSAINYELNAYYIFDRAYDSFKELYRIHLTGSFFVVRAKSNLKCKFCKWKRRMPKNILSDAEVKLLGYTSEKKYPESFRIIRLYDEENDREFTFLTNAKRIYALDVANLYKIRWLVELFLKWLKQHLKIKRFWGNYRECSSNTDKCRHRHLLCGSYCPTWYANKPFKLWGFTDYQHLTDGKNTFTSSVQ